jgi:arylsulfatase A-like enzyme
MNCLVICCDTFRYDLIDNPEVRTPHLSRLAGESINFVNACAEALPTIQARRTLFTGIRSFPWRFEAASRGLWPQIMGWHAIPAEQMTLAEWLWENGVVTGLIGDTYHMFKSSQNFVRGFCSWDFIRGQESDNWRSGPLSAVDTSPYLPEGAGEHGHLRQYLLNMRGRTREEEYLTPRVFRRACDWVADNRENAPWFLWVDSFAPHEYWDPPREFADAYFATDACQDFIAPQAVNGIENPSREVIERTKALYHGYVTFVDKWIGRLLEKLDELGALDETAILFTSDHGTEIWDKGRFGKGGDRLYRYNARVPFLLRLPGGARGGTVREDMAQHLDVFPTVATLLGCPPEAGLAEDGLDLLHQNLAPREKAIIAWGPNVSVRDTEWNLILRSDRPDEPGRLYDLTADPQEETDCFAERPEVVAAYRGHLEETLGPLPYAIAHHGDDRQSPPNVYRALQRRQG